jgi:hypothetical protein
VTRGQTIRGQTIRGPTIRLRIHCHVAPGSMIQGQTIRLRIRCYVARGSMIRGWSTTQSQLPSGCRRVISAVAPPSGRRDDVNAMSPLTNGTDCPFGVNVGR